MWAPVSRLVPNLWHGFDQIPVASVLYIAKTGRPTQRKATPSCLERAQQIGKAFLKQRRAQAVWNTISSSRKAVGFRSSTPLASASILSVRFALKQRAQLWILNRLRNSNFQPRTSRRKERRATVRGRL